MKGVFSEGGATSERINCFLLLNQHYLCQTVPRLAHFVMHSEGRFSSGKISFTKAAELVWQMACFCHMYWKGFWTVAKWPGRREWTAAFAEKALPLAKMSNNALFLSRLVKGVFLRENFLQEMLKSGLTIGPFLSYLLEGLWKDVRHLGGATMTSSAETKLVLSGTLNKLAFLSRLLEGSFFSGRSPFLWPGSGRADAPWQLHTNRGLN